jgi:hypothetical protein
MRIPGASVPQPQTYAVLYGDRRHCPLFAASCGIKVAPAIAAAVGQQKEAARSAPGRRLKGGWFDPPVGRLFRIVSEKTRAEPMRHPALCHYLCERVEVLCRGPMKSSAIALIYLVS